MTSPSWTTPLTAATLKGNWASLLLPINADETIDYGLLAAEIDVFVAAGVNGIYSNGSAGEFYAQSEAEFDHVSELLSAKCLRAGMPFQIGASHMSPQISLERVRRAKSLQPSGIQIVLPDWFVPGWDEIIGFLQVMTTEAAPVPLILYNPPHAKRILSPSQWLDITDCVPGVIGAKVAGGDDTWYDEMQPVLESISVFIPGHQLATGLARGARGSYSNVASLSPVGAQRWYELCVSDPVAGERWQQSILEFWQANIVPLITNQGLSNMAADKASAVAGGWLPGLSPRLRWPYHGASHATIGEIAGEARACLPQFFSE